MKSVSLDLLRTFITFVESSNIVEAAQRLHLSQPAVSVQLKKLEESLPLPLFLFRGKKKVLSQYGRTLYRAIKEGVTDIHRALEHVNASYADPSRLHLRIGARKEILYRMAPFVQFPGSVEFVHLTTAESLQKLLQYDIDVAIAYETPNYPHIISRHLFSEATKFCIHESFLKGKPLNLERIQDPAFLTSIPCLAYKKDQPPFIQEWCRVAGLDVSQLFIKCICEDWIAIMKMIEEGVGFSIVPEGIKTSHLGSKIHEIKIPESVIPKMNFYLLYNTSLKQMMDTRSLIRLSRPQKSSPNGKLLTTAPSWNETRT